VRGADHAQWQVLDLGQRIANLVLEGTHDTVEIEVKVAREVGDLVVEEPGCAVVGAEGITGEENLILDQIGEHGVGPVHVRGENETQRAAAEVEFLAVRHHVRLERRIDQLLEKVFPRLGDINGDVRVSLQKRDQCPGVVRLGVVDNDDVDLLQGDQFLEFAQECLGEGRLDRVDQRGLGVAANQVRIVGRAVVGRKKVVKNLQFRVLGSDPMNSRGDFGDFGHFLAILSMDDGSNLKMRMRKRYPIGQIVTRVRASVLYIGFGWSGRERRRSGWQHV
jgi:hypothetical protein